MGRRLDGLIAAIREEKGPFFMARLCLRLSFSVNPGDVPDSPERERELVTACRALGYEPNIAERSRESK